MNRKQWKRLIGINALLAVLASLQFLPGPRGLAGVSITIHSLFQIAGLFCIITFLIGLKQSIFRYEKFKEGVQTNFVGALLLCTSSFTIFLFSLGPISPFADFSRGVALRQANKIVVAAEKYKVANSHYPPELNALVPQYLPKIPSPIIMGIPKFDYTNRGERYSLRFTQNVLIGFNWEEVVYDPLDKHSEDYPYGDFMNTGYAHWKYYIYD